MFKTTHKSRLVKVAAATAAIGSIAAIGFVGSSTASADPKQLSALVGVGSDTTQDVMNALSGESTGKLYNPVKSANGVQIISFNATNPAGGTNVCITTKLNGPSFLRPNGSTNGIGALSRAIDAFPWGTTIPTGSTSPPCGAAKNLRGFVDFARSSSAPEPSQSTALTYVPFARDALSFAYYKADTPANVVSSLTRAQLTSIFTNGATTLPATNGVGTVRVLPCGIQSGSGTFTSWNTVTTAGATETAATNECNLLLATGSPKVASTGRAQENNGVQLKARGDAANTAVPGTQVIIGFSAGSFISKANGTALPANPAGVLMGSISDPLLGSPVQAGTLPGTLAPNPTFFANGAFGRDLYNVFDTAQIDDVFGLYADLQSIFKDLDPSAAVNTATICADAADDIVKQFGFIVSPSCGSTSEKTGLGTRTG